VILLKIPRLYVAFRYVELRWLCRITHIRMVDKVATSFDKCLLKWFVSAEGLLKDLWFLHRIGVLVVRLSDHVLMLGL
jgi:hypothetical protein